MIIKTRMLRPKLALKVGDEINYLYPNYNCSKFKPWKIIKAVKIVPSFEEELEKLEKLLIDYKKENTLLSKFQQMETEIKISKIKLDNRGYEEKYKYWYII